MAVKARWRRPEAGRYEYVTKDATLAVVQRVEDGEDAWRLDLLVEVPENRRNKQTLFWYPEMWQAKSGAERTLQHWGITA